MKKFWQWMTRPNPKVAALTQWTLLACMIVLLVEVWDVKSERDALRERVELQQLQWDSLNRVNMKLGIDVTYYSARLRECLPDTLPTHTWEPVDCDIRPDSTATLTRWDDVVYQVTGKNRLSVFDSTK